MTRRIVWSECPAPSVVEQDDLERWLSEAPERPSQRWAARVLGRIYAPELENMRDESDAE